MTVRRLPRSRWVGERRLSFVAESPATGYIIQFKPTLGNRQNRIGWSRYPEHDKKARPLQHMTIRVWDRRLPRYLTTEEPFEVCPQTEHRPTVREAINTLVSRVFKVHEGQSYADVAMGGLSRAIVDANSLRTTQDMIMPL